MSEISTRQPRRRRRRADADRSAAAVLDAAVEVLGQHPDASVDHVAAAAGLARQTVYAHYPSRRALLAAVVDRITADAVAALDAADLDSGAWSRRHADLLEREELDCGYRLVVRG